MQIEFLLLAEFEFWKTGLYFGECVYAVFELLVYYVIGCRENIGKEMGYAHFVFWVLCSAQVVWLGLVEHEEHRNI